MGKFKGKMGKFKADINKLKGEIKQSLPTNISDVKSIIKEQQISYEQPVIQQPVIQELPQQTIKYPQTSNSSKLIIMCLLCCIACLCFIMSAGGFTAFGLRLSNTWAKTSASIAKFVDDKPAFGSTTFIIASLSCCFCMCLCASAFYVIKPKPS